MRQFAKARRSCLVLAFSALALALAAGGAAHANGTIDVAESAVASGAAPQPGAVFVDPCAPPGPAPAMPSIGTPTGALGTMTGGVAPFPGGGSGADGAFHATSDTTLFGGTYEFTSYAVDPGVVLHYASAVVIRTTGNVVIDGQIIVDLGGITFECAGDLSVRANNRYNIGGLNTFGALMRFDVAGALRFIDVSEAPGESTTAFQTQGTGDVEIVARGGTVGAPLEIRNAYIGALRIDVRSATGIVLYGGGGLNTFFDGGISVRAFGGDIDVQRTTAYSYGPVTFDASGALRGELGFFRSWSHGDVRLTAFGGPLVLKQGSIYATEGGDVRLRAAGSAELQDGVLVEVVPGYSGAMEMTAFGGDVKLTGAGNRFENQGVGPVSLAASGAMTIDASATVKTAQGDVTLRAFGGALTSSGTVVVDAGAGALDVGASGDVSAAAGGDVDLSGDSLRVVGDRLDLAADLVARAGDLTLASHGALAGRGTMTAAGSFTATSIAGDVTFDDSTITTADDLGGRSGDVRIETFGGATAARIAARRATIASGDSAAASGDVVLRVVTVPRPTVANYLLPANVALKLGGKRPGLKADGTIACPGEWLTPGEPASLPFVFAAGTKHVAGDLALRPNGNDREFKAPGVLVRVSPSKTGTSKGVFSVRIDEDLTGLVPADGLVDFFLSLDGREFRGTVRLAGGKFKLGSTRGAVSELLYPLAVTAQVKGGGRDTLALTLGFASDGVTPAAAPELSLDFGDGFSVKIDPADFVRSGDKFVAKNPPSAPGLTSVVLDYAKETLTVKGKLLDLGSFPAESPVSIRIGVGFDGDLRSVDVALSRKGTKLTY